MENIDHLLRTSDVDVTQPSALGQMRVKRVNKGFPLYKSVTISATQTLSNFVDLGNFSLGAIVMPPAFDGTQISFMASVDNVTFYDIYDSYGNLVLIQVAANRWVDADKALFYPVQSLKIKAATVQTSARTFTVIGVA